MGKRKKNTGHSQRQSRITISGFTVALPNEMALTEIAAGEKILGVLSSVPSEMPQHGVSLVPVTKEDHKHAFISIATNAWRAKVKMLDANTGEAKDEMKRVYRHIEAISEALKDVGIEIIDPTGRAYDSGMALKVVAFEQTPGLSKEEIKETIKPSITWNGKLLQVGEVIVGTPEMGKTEDAQ